MSRMNGPDEEYNYCDEHGEYPLDEFECPGCAEAEQRIDEAIERAHQQGGSHGKT